MARTPRGVPGQAQMLQAVVGNHDVAAEALDEHLAPRVAVGASHHRQAGAAPQQHRLVAHLAWVGTLAHHHRPALLAAPRLFLEKRLSPEAAFDCVQRVVDGVNALLPRVPSQRRLAIEAGNVCIGR